MERTYLVTGGAGYVGSHVVRYLSEAGHRVVTYDSLARGYRDAVRWGEFVPGDLLDRERLFATVASHAFDGVVHMAGLIAVEESVREPRLFWRNNVIGTRNLLDAMESAGVRNIVFSSSACVYGDPLGVPIDEEHPVQPDNPYGETKAQSEHDIAERQGIEGVLLRYFNAAGAHADGSMGEAHEPETHLVPLVLRASAERPIRVFGTDYPTPDGTAVRDYVHVWDLARAHLAALDFLVGGGTGRALNLGSGSGNSVLEVIEAVRRVTGRAPAMEMGPRRSGDVARLVASRQRASDLLEWAPTRGLETIVGDAWRWHREHPNGYRG